MREFVDLLGASGTFYRFRLWPEGGANPPIAGNYVVVRHEADGLALLLAGITAGLMTQGLSPLAAAAAVGCKGAPAAMKFGPQTPNARAASENGAVDCASCAGGSVRPALLHSSHVSVVIVKPGGTGMPMTLISARLAPLPPSRAFISALPSALPPPNE